MPDDQQAKGKIDMAIQRLAHRYPFHAKVLERFRVAAQPSVGTMAVTVDTDELFLLYNAAFVRNTRFDELVGVLLHETNHVALGHLTADPSEFSDPWARTVAAELTANEFVHEQLPGRPILLEDFPDLPPLESTRDRYERLRRETDRSPIEPPPDPADQADDSGASSDGGGIPGESPDQPTDEAEPDLRTVDDHSVWPSDDQRERAAQLIAHAVEDALVQAGDAEVPQQLLDAARHVHEIGRLPGNQRRGVDQHGRPRLDWRRLLRSFVGRVLQPRPTFARPPRRFPELIGILPARRRQRARPKVMTVVDTSASISHELLEIIVTELQSLARNYHVIVVECDAAVQNVYDFRTTATMSLTGGGGTDFRPPLAADFLMKHRPDVVVFFSDGYGPVPKSPPPIPVLWCLTPGGEPPAAWAKVIYMEDDR